jgi:adenine phosphoribosyltransferase
MDAEALSRHVRTIPDFPKPGILFRDVTPLLQHPEALRAAVDAVAAPFREVGVERVAGIESRGFILGVPVALALGTGFTLIRKAGRLPYRTHRVEYALEYGTDSLEMHVDGVESGQQVLIVDDLIATGGTAAAAVELIRKVGGDVVGGSFLIELAHLAGRERLADLPATHAVLSY